MKPFVSVIILGSGESARFGKDKMQEDLCGKTVIERSVSVFQDSEAFSEIIVTASKRNIETVKELTVKYSKVKAVTEGGENRTESAVRALEFVSENADFVAVHDGARPLITETAAEKVLSAALLSGAAIPVMPIRDTVKKVCRGKVTDTLDRSELFSAATPQIFSFGKYKELLTDAYKKGESYTDDSFLFENAGIPVSAVESDRENIKITYPEDAVIAKAILGERSK